MNTGPRNPAMACDCDPEELILTPIELAQRWRISTRTLDRWRASRTGPRWMRIGGRILYRMTDILDYEQARLRGSAR